MARKNLLDGLMNARNEAEASARKAAGAPAPADRPAASPPRRQTGAIGAVSQSLAELRTRALVEVPTDMIDDAGLKDRFDPDPEGIAQLMESLREYGQQVPVMLRHSPSHEGRYEIVYGRRRVQALRQLGMPVRAMVRELDDRELIVAQGQENSVRKDLSFIEKATFALKMIEGCFERKVVCEALNINKSELSRLEGVAKAIPESVIKAIGSAPSVGRARWITLSKRIGDRPVDQIVALASGDTSDARFKAVFDALASEQSSEPKVKKIITKNGVLLAEAQRRGGKPVMTLHDDSFADWLRENMARLHEEFSCKDGE
ncbi:MULTISPECIES: plasmid partitioning protein RepB [Thioclava]|uniref:plasmid partitioning protein RepB n=1 Tax=Thioclava TaxID=285107 RepID=UPI000B5410C7|nr:MULTISPECIES: plasmid partitioning protein RepB [Thioclava]OWY09336.1 plasmid partitioning protein RepB [Thioclava sp. JM3]WGT52585.1 plasmid partitioning protein RepB [Thioclava nitratireducens]